MDFIVSANTDIGIAKSTNQDSLLVKVADTIFGKVVLSVLCDGMGGLQSGEIASASVVNAFNNWFADTFLQGSNQTIDFESVKNQWSDIIFEMNEKIKQYGDRNGFRLGTTVCAMLFFQNKYLLLNVGDTRAYELSDNVYQLTKDHTVVAHEIEMGYITEVEAENDPRRNVLLQCCGASDIVYPDFFLEEIKPDTVYMLCTDGFRHVVTSDEIYAYFAPNTLYDKDTMDKNAGYLIELNKQRLERDNISVVLIRTI